MRYLNSRFNFFFDPKNIQAFNFRVDIDAENSSGSDTVFLKIMDALFENGMQISFLNDEIPDILKKIGTDEVVVPDDTQWKQLQLLMLKKIKEAIGKKLAEANSPAEIPTAA